MNLTDQIQNLYQQQLASWPMAGENYAALRNVRVRTICVEDQEIRLQFNPKRIISSAAKIDPESISSRPCFLCEVNRPKEQSGIMYDKRYIILVNPYPIFNRHLTIPSSEHIPQRIYGNLDAMLHLAKDLPGYTVIYNGPGCGASAPDHFHFQAIHRNLLPIEKEFKGRLSDSDRIIHHTGIYFLKNYLRKAVIFRSDDHSDILRVFEIVLRLLGESMPMADEPMMNILGWYEDNNWIITIFPRKMHRPSQYFETGEKQILLSPASIDMGGVLIFPREADYEKITTDDISDIFNQVSVDEFFISVLMDRLKLEL